MSAAVKQVRVTPSELKKIEFLCKNPTNWTDGGYWQGPGRAPDCFQKIQMAKSTQITVRWPTDDSAKRWNDNWSKAQRNMGYVGTAFVSIVAWQLNLPKVAVGIGVGSDVIVDILKGEAIARIPHPTAARGWRMETKLSVAFNYSPASKRLNGLKSELVVQLFDHKNTPQGPVVPLKTSYSFDDFPMELAYKMASGPDRKIDINY